MTGNKRINRLVITVCLGACGLAFPATLKGQVIRESASNFPPTASQQQLSPYLNLLRPDNGALSPYHSFVRPQRELVQRQTNQAAELRRLQNSFARSQPYQQTPSSRLPTGNHARFQSTLHYFPNYQLQP